MEPKLALTELEFMTEAELIRLKEAIALELDRRPLPFDKTASMCLDLFFVSQLAINFQSQAEMDQLVAIYRSKRGVPSISMFYPNSLSDAWGYFKHATCCYITETGDLWFGDLAKCRRLSLTIVPFRDCIEGE